MNAHLRAAGLTYLAHLRRAWSFGLRMAKGAAALLVHGLVPAWFEHTGSDLVREMYLEIIEHEIKRDTITYTSTGKTDRSSASSETPAPF